MVVAGIRAVANRVVGVGEAGLAVAAMTAVGVIIVVGMIVVGVIIVVAVITTEGGGVTAAAVVVIILGVTAVVGAEGSMIARVATAVQ